MTSTTVATSPRAAAKKKEDSEKKNDSEKKGDGEKKRFGVRRAKTMQSMRPAENVDEKAKPAQAKVLVPTVLFDPAEAAKQVTKAESNSYKLPATRKQGMPVFRGAAFKKGEDGKISVYATVWQPHGEVVFSRPHVVALFETVDQSALASKNLQAIIDGLDAQDEAKYNMPGIKAKPKEMIQVPAIQKEIDWLLFPLTKALDGTPDLLGSILPAPTLQFLLCLDNEVKNWGDKTRQNLRAKLAMQVPDSERVRIQATLDAQLSDKERAKLEVKLGKNLSAEKRAELQAIHDKQLPARDCEKLRLKLEFQISSAEQAKIQEQLDCFESELLETRKSSLSAFIGVRGLNQFFKLRHPPEHQIFSLIDMRLATLLLTHPVIDKIMNCSKEERLAIQKASKMQMISMQSAWKVLRNEKGVADRLARSVQQDLEEWNQQHPKKARKAEKLREKESALASGSTSTEALVSPRAKGDAKKANFNTGSVVHETKRQNLMRRFIDQWGLNNIEDPLLSKTLLTGLKEHQESANLTTGALIRFCVDTLGNYIAALNKEGIEPNDDILDLRAEMMAFMVAQKKSVSSKGSAKPDTKGD